MFLLDTNVCIALLNGGMGPIKGRVIAARTAGSVLCVSSISIFELEFGIEKSAPHRQAENRRRLENFLIEPSYSFLDYDVRDAAAAGRIRDHLRRMGRPIGPYDTLIAGQASARGLTVVTANHGEFARVPGLTVEDWSAA